MAEINYGAGVQSFGDSFTVGYNATGTNGYAARIAAVIGGPFSNFGAGSKGVSVAAKSAYTNHAIGPRPKASTWMAGLNDIRGYGINALDKIELGLTAFLASAFLGAYKPASQMTKVGGWAALANNWGGKSFALGGTPLFVNNNMGASLSWSFTGDHVVIGSYTTNGTTGYYQDLEIDIDGVVQTFEILGKTNEQASCAAMLVVGLVDGAHTITIRPTTTAAHTVVDFVGTLTNVNKSPVFVSLIPYIPDWGLYGSIATPAICDAANVVIEETVGRFQALGLNAHLVRPVEFYDTVAGCSSDNLHPNDRGHSQLAMMFLNEMKIV